MLQYFSQHAGIQLGQWWHEARVDWLELNESGQLLLLRDTRRRLALLRLPSGDKVRIQLALNYHLFLSFFRFCMLLYETVYALYEILLFFVRISWGGGGKILVLICILIPKNNEKYIFGNK